MREYCVYKHTAPNGKVYIGITKQSPQDRWKRGKGYDESCHFYSAIQKYGWDAILHEVLYTGLSKEAAEEMEVALIAEYQSNNPQFGYNIAKGGLTPAPTEETKKRTSQSLTEFWSDSNNAERMKKAMRGVKRSEEARRNISERQKLRFENEEERRKISERQRGMKRSEEALQKQSESLKAYYANPLNQEKITNRINRLKEQNRMIHARKVLCVETGEVFDAITDAAAKYGIERKNLSAVCNGRRKRAGGYTWRLIGEQLKNRGD